MVQLCGPNANTLGSNQTRLVKQSLIDFSAALLRDGYSAGTSLPQRIACIAPRVRYPGRLLDPGLNVNGGNA